MRSRAAAGTVVFLLLLGVAAPAWAAPTTEVIQGRILRLVSVADWAAAGAMRPGQEIPWDVAVSADSPDPGIVKITLSATGDAPLILDVSMCRERWRASRCPGGAVALRSGWEIPRDGSEVELLQLGDTAAAHVRFGIRLAPGVETGSTDVRLHARGEGEAVAVGPDGGLAATGGSLVGPWTLAAGAVLIVGGLLLAARGRGGRGDRDRMVDPGSASGSRSAR